MVHLSASELVERWRASSLVEELVLGFGGSIAWINFVIKPNHSIATLNDFLPDGAFGTLISFAKKAVLFGANKKNPEFVNGGVTIEENARMRLTAILSAIQRSAMPTPPKNSSGWTFCMWSDGSPPQWRDLSGRDVYCTEFWQCGAFEVLHTNAENAACILQSQLELPLSTQSVIRDILITKRVSYHCARELRPTISQEELNAALVRTGFAACP